MLFVMDKWLCCKNTTSSINISITRLFQFSFNYYSDIFGQFILLKTKEGDNYE